MSNPRPKSRDSRAADRIGPSIPRGFSLGQHRNYADASAVVERLIEADFPANQISIIGSDVKLVERVRSRLGYGRVAYSGAITGVWMGLIFAVLIGAGVDVGATGEVSYNPSEFIAAVVIGAGVGMLFNIARFSLAKNRRGFISMAQSVATSYEVVVPDSEASNATRALNRSGNEVESENSAG